MLVQRHLPKRFIFGFGIRVTLLSMGWAALIYAVHTYLGVEQLRVPFLPIATIGTAVAFYIGFKNNSAYERFWEGRKIWGGIVNDSRQWGAAVLGYLGSPAPPSAESRWAGNPNDVTRELIYRHLAWINALRLQLRRTTRFHDRPHPRTRERLERHADHMRNDWDRELSPFLSAGELATVTAQANPATHLLHNQARQLATLHAEKHLDLFHQIDLMKLVREHYALQGKCERIKNTPFPRLYAEYSRWFTRVFLMLVPMGLLDVFSDEVAQGSLSPLSMLFPMMLAAGLISWVFFSMEGIGDASEDPFERSMNDVPMNALCRTIERDLRQMLGEDDIPPPEAPIEHILY